MGTESEKKIVFFSALLRENRRICNKILFFFWSAKINLSDCICLSLANAKFILFRMLTKSNRTKYYYLLNANQSIYAQIITIWMAFRTTDKSLHYKICNKMHINLIIFFKAIYEISFDGTTSIGFILWCGGGDSDGFFLFVVNLMSFCCSCGKEDEKNKKK